METRRLFLSHSVAQIFSQGDSKTRAEHQCPGGLVSRWYSARISGYPHLRSGFLFRENHFIGTSSLWIHCYSSLFINTIVTSCSAQVFICLLEIHNGCHFKCEATFSFNCSALLHILFKERYNSKCLFKIWG